MKYSAETPITMSDKAKSPLRVCTNLLELQAEKELTQLLFLKIDVS